MLMIAIVSTHCFNPTVLLMSELQHAAVQLPAKGATNEKEYLILPWCPFNTVTGILI